MKKQQIYVEFNAQKTQTDDKGLTRLEWVTFLDSLQREGRITEKQRIDTMPPKEIRDTKKN